MVNQSYKIIASPSEGIHITMALISSEKKLLTTDTINPNVTLLSDTPTLAPNADEPCKLYLFITYVIIFGSMCIFGLIGNTLSFLVLQWEKRAHTATFLLRVMALVDNFYLITVGFSSIFSALTLFLGYVDNPIQPYIMLIVWPLVYIAQMSTVWSTLLIAFNRYIAICKPFRAPLLCTMKKIRIQIIIITLFILLYNVPRFFEFEIYTHYEEKTGQNITVGKPTALKTNVYYNIIYENVLYCLFYFLGPLVILIVFNVCLIRELMMARRRLLDRNLPVSGEEEENNLTLVMIVIILVFLVCQTPAFLNQLLAYVLPEDAYFCGKPYYYFYHTSNVMASANSCLNFVIYCVFRKQFRQRMKAFCRCKSGLNTMQYAERYTCDGETVTMYVNSNSNNASKTYLLKDKAMYKNGNT